jgi:trk system potassium uptake protein TrkH
MLVPAFHAYHLGIYSEARPFFYSGILFFVLAVMLGLSIKKGSYKTSPISPVAFVAASYALFPVMLAVPLNEILNHVTFIDLYFEMVSSLTTTGATTFDTSYILSEPIHLWRALVGWIGGFLFLLIAFSILAPLNLGGFEIFRDGSFITGVFKSAEVKSYNERLFRNAKKLFPLYLTVTALIFLLLLFCGNRAFDSLCLAFSTVSTSGLLPYNDSSYLNVNGASQLVISFILICSLSHIFLSNTQQKIIKRLKTEREIRVALIIILSVFAFLCVWKLFIYTFSQGGFLSLDKFAEEMGAGLFTIISFITTSGFFTASAEKVISEIGGSVPFLILVGLSTIGGGVATTSGGIKLIRIYTLYKHGKHELSKLSHPRSVSSYSSSHRQISHEGAFYAWIFLMVFTFTGGLLILILSFFGIEFKNAVAISLSMLSTTGPLAPVILDDFSYGSLSQIVKVCLAIAMIISRFEILVFISLLNFSAWER